MEEIIIPCKYLKDVSLKDKTWIHRGGLVSYWMQPETIAELVAVGRLLYQINEPFVTIGHTSNTYFKDSFNVKYLIDTRNLTDFSKLDSKTLVCECGAPMAKISCYCVEEGISGYEGMVGLPGTAGGGIFCNSGCYGCGIEKVLLYIDLLTPNGEIVRIDKEQLGFTFRSSVMKIGDLKGIILRAYFDISKKDDKRVLLSIAEKTRLDRKETQDSPAQNLGSTLNTNGFRGGVRNSIINLFVRIYAHIFRDKHKRYIFRKRLTLLMYGLISISRYISDKRMNCFIWKDDGADAAFPLYLDMMNKVFKDCELEIITF